MPPPTFTRKPEETKSPVASTPQKTPQPVASGTGAPAGAPLFLRGMGQETAGPVPGIQRQGDAGTKKGRFLGVDDSEFRSRESLIASGLHLANPVDHYQNALDSKGRKVRIEKWKDKDGNYLWYRVHEGPAMKPEDVPDPNDPATEREGEEPALAEARSYMREWRRTTKQTLPIHDQLWSMRANGQGNTPEYNRLIEQADQFFDQGAEWERDFRETMPEWREQLAGKPDALAELEGLSPGDVASLRTWLDDFKENRDPDANQKRLDEMKRAEEELKQLAEQLKNPPPVEEVKEEDGGSEEQPPE